MLSGSENAASGAPEGHLPADPEPRPPFGLEGLLTPSLDNAPARPLYSPSAAFYSGFFGGPYATLLMMHLNSRRLNRTRADAPFQLGVALGWALIGYGLYAWVVRSGLDASLGPGHRALGLVMHGSGLLVAGATYLRHRPYHRALRMAGTPPKRGTIAWILACLAGAVLELGLIALASS